MDYNDLKKRIQDHTGKVKNQTLSTLQQSDYFEETLENTDPKSTAQNTTLSELSKRGIPAASFEDIREELIHTLSDSLTSTTNYDDLQRVYERVKQVEETAYEKLHIDAADYEDRELYKPYSCDAEACKALLGKRDLAKDYPLEEARGVFEGNYNYVSYRESAEFGEWETTGFHGAADDGYYSINPDDSPYRAYKMQQMKLTIEKTCKEYPEFIFEDLQSDPELLQQVYNSLDQTDPDPLKSLDRPNTVGPNSKFLDSSAARFCKKMKSNSFGRDNGIDL